ncbi:hypothetical protein C1645_838807 [Glomus cerebriforme]|uniref:Uncharacterized protein n=1 Tax=Glomus cerebriforme TaxID=658196 RepID=A0A397S7U9_9GLOM|nr:hypothetical protein C1645_838807 [Glomus cerebriforme]
MSSELELLRQRITELEAENSRVLAENAFKTISSFTRSEPVVVPDCETKDVAPEVCLHSKPVPKSSEENGYRWYCLLKELA